ncbi:hypothetical protein [Sphingobacterium sp.]|uniref:hypothetical protein n=1 Tax=Sphingobacterium sp. TaxID=341027 RepID=UPI00289BDF55|nr:hypothetical protein [Sphingobacterium sp.]
MKRLIIVIATLTFATVSFAQKAEVKGDDLLSDGKLIAKIEKDGCGALSPTCNFYVSSIGGEPLVTVVALDMIDPMQSTAGNPEGKVRFLRFSFTGIDGVAEIRNPAMLATKPKDVAQSIIKARLIKDGKLDESAVINFIQANSDRYTQRQKELTPQLIIIR